MERLEVKNREDVIKLKSVRSFLNNNLIYRRYYGWKDKNKDNWDGTYFVSYKCPACDKESNGAMWMSKPWKDAYGKDREYGEKELDKIHSNILFRRFMCHLSSQIRMRGCEIHMELFLNIFGKKFTKYKFTEWAKASVIVSNNLNKFVESINKPPIVKESTLNLNVNKEKLLTL